MCQHCGEHAPPNLTAHTILLVASGGGARRAVVKDLLATGAQVVCYNREISWAKEYISEWIVGSFSDHEAAWAAISRCGLGALAPGFYTSNIVTCPTPSKW